jgi:PDZ domain-containing protein/PEGA domain-containing protein
MQIRRATPAVRGETAVSHRGRRGASLARRDDREYRWLPVLGLVTACLLVAPRPALTQAVDPQYAEAKRLFEALDYESAIRTLDLAISGLEARPAQDPARRELLPIAYEMRARSKFGLGDQNGAKADFVTLLKVDAGHALTGQVSPRVVVLFEDTVKQTVTTLNLTVTPPTAKVDLDGVPVPANSTIPVTIGDHTITGDQIGYRKGQQTFAAEAGTPSTVALTLERVSSVLNILTSPGDVDVTIDGVKRGKTAAGPPPASYNQAIASTNIPPAQVSTVMVVGDVPQGSHLIEFTRECYVKVETRLPVDKPDDYTVGPIALNHAVATLSVTSNDPTAQVVIDGQARGVAPFTTADLCEGEHTVELRSSSGRYFKRLQARTGDSITVKGLVKPAFALLSAFGQAAGSPDLRAVVERLFDPSVGVTLFAPPQEQSDQALKANQLPVSWLAFDGNKRQMGTSPDVGSSMRRDVSVKLSNTFGTQGVAAVTVLDRSRVIVSLLASGSSDPDVLEVSLDNGESVRRAIALLDRMPLLFRPAIGLVAMDVADVTGAIVAAVDANGPAAKAGIKVGDTVVKVNDQPAVDAAALATALASRKANDDLKLELKDRTGAIRQATVKVYMTPRVIGISDQTLVVNSTLVALRARLLGTSDSTEQTVLRLNLAAALARVEAWGDARAELQRVTLPDGGGVANGTVQYLLGLCADRLGNRAEAETAFRAAAASDSLLTEDGPPVKELAQARLAELSRPAGD